MAVSPFLKQREANAAIRVPSCLVDCYCMLSRQPSLSDVASFQLPYKEVKKEDRKDDVKFY